jgi:hypothetical protein
MGKIKEEAPHTENMGIFEYETTLAIVNLIDTLLAFTMVVTIFILLKVASILTVGFP